MKQEAGCNSPVFFIPDLPVKTSPTISEPSRNFPHKINSKFFLGALHTHFPYAKGPRLRIFGKLLY